MSEVYVWPDDVTVEIHDDATLLDLAVEGGVDIAHLCGGRARCSTCRVRVIEGNEVLSPRTEAEATMAQRLDFPEEVRLACQTTARGSVRFWRLVLDTIDIEMASQLGKGHYTGPVGREVENAAILFSDVAGFTSMAEALPAYDVVHILNRFFNRAGDAVEANGGRVDNYMGDGLLAVFGIDGESDRCFAAVRTGLDLIEIASDMHDYVSMIYGQDFKIRVGVDIGDVIFGLMGAESTARETVLGDVVNTASRLEAANKATGTTMLVTEAVRSRTDTRVDYGERFDLDLRGKHGTVAAYDVLGPRETSEPAS